MPLAVGDRLGPYEILCLPQTPSVFEVREELRVLAAPKVSSPVLRMQFSGIVNLGGQGSFWPVMVG